MVAGLPIRLPVNSVKRLTVISGLAWGSMPPRTRSIKDPTRPTIGVLGNGLGFVYPKEFKIYEQVKIVAHWSQSCFLMWLLMRETFLHATDYQWTNSGTLIVKPPAKSGALITAEYALEQGKEIYALPALGQDTGEGNNRLIQESRAIVTGAEDILKDLQDKIIYYKTNLPGI